MLIILFHFIKTFISGFLPGLKVFLPGFKVFLPGFKGFLPGFKGFLPGLKLFSTRSTPLFYYSISRDRHQGLGSSSGT